MELISHSILYIPDREKSLWVETSFVGELFNKVRNTPDSIPVGIREELASLAAELNGANEALKNSKEGNADNKLWELKEKAKIGLQKYIREGKTAEFKNNKEYEKILRHAKNFDEIRAGDILRMKWKGENIAKFLLTNEKWDEINLDNKSAQSFIQETLLVNFWVNSSINASIGLGDIIPHNIRKVEVSGKKGVQVGTLLSVDPKTKRERVGYYTETGEYIAVYDGYKVRLLEIGEPTKEELQEIQNVEKKWTNRVRVNEMIEYYIARNGFKKSNSEEIRSILSEEFGDNSDQELFPIVEDNLNARIIRQAHIRESYKDGIGSRDKFIGKFGWYIRDIIQKDFPNITPHMLVNLFQQENANFDPTARNKSGAFGLGQIKPDTWNEIEEKIVHKNLDKESPYDQIYASAAYINSIMQSNRCEMGDAIIYYHMGPNVKSAYIDKNDLRALQRYKDANEPIRKLMTEDSWWGYWNAARKYYLDVPGLLTSLDLSKSGTELATKLWDYVMSTSLPNTWKNSCWRAVGELLNSFWIQGLPDSGRDGKNWDNILEPRVTSGQFKKVAIKHPDEAGAGAILAYENGIWGSQANKDHGHVEIKGSDGKYYSYYEWGRSGGSAATNEKNPEKYRELTGFIGFAYYPVQKQA